MVLMVAFWLVMGEIGGGVGWSVGGVAASVLGVCGVVGWSVCVARERGGDSSC